jgi:hypothetical protein
MLQYTNALYGNKLAASDGDIGHVKDFYFDDKNWVIRYLVVDAGTWLTGRLVLISPHAFGKLDQEGKTVNVKLRKKQIENSPLVETHQPVSRQYEVKYYRYYGWPAYWNGGGMWGLGGYPVLLPPPRDETVAQQKFQHRDDKHLQSTLAVTGYYIETVDGTLGHVKGFLVDDTNWSIRELVVETGHWYSGREVLISPTKVDRISYVDSTVFVNLTKAEIQQTQENEVVQAGARALPAGHIRS